MIQKIQIPETLSIIVVVSLMLLAATGARSLFELGPKTCLAWKSLKSSGARVRVLVVLFSLFFLLWNLTQVTTPRQYLYPHQTERYPFTRFAMFASASPGWTVWFSKFVGVDSEGRRQDLNLAKIYPTLAHTGLFSRTSRLTAMLKSNASERLFAEKELTEWSKSLKRNGEQTGQGKFMKIEFVQVVHSSRIGEGAKLLREETVWSSEEAAR